MPKPCLIKPKHIGEIIQFVTSPQPRNRIGLNRVACLWRTGADVAASGIANGLIDDGAEQLVFRLQGLGMIVKNIWVELWTTHAAPFRGEKLGSVQRGTADGRLYEI